MLADLYLRAGVRPAPPPSRATIWRMVTDAGDGRRHGGHMADDQPACRADHPLPSRDADHDDPAEPVLVRRDGKAVRGARDAAGNQQNPLAALVGRTAETSVIAAQAEVGVKTKEVPMATDVPSRIDLHGTLVTADARHRRAARSAHSCWPWDDADPIFPWLVGSSREEERRTARAPSRQRRQ